LDISATQAAGRDRKLPTVPLRNDNTHHFWITYIVSGTTARGNRAPGVYRVGQGTNEERSFTAFRKFTCKPRLSPNILNAVKSLP
jgi:hypothetical protein